MSPYTVMMGIILILTPVTCWVFTLGNKEKRTPLNKMFEVIHEKRYYLHALGYIFIIKWKALTDKYNEPIKIRTGNWTELIYSIEGNTTLWIQQTFENAWLTEFLNFHYLFIYLFLIYITTVYFAYVGERDMTDKVTLNYLLIYAIAVPYYLFVNVEVTSSWIPGMKALLYHDGWYTVFYATHDPLDNAVPSLHVAIPFGIILLNWLHCKEKGIKMREWAHWPYHLFIVINTILFIFTIAYLGIHWLLDIPLGMAVGALGALFIHYIQPRLRNDKGHIFEGVDKQKVKRHAMWEGAIAILMFLLIITAISYQDENMDDSTSMRVGGGHSNFEILKSIGYGSEISSSITNLDDSLTLQFTVIWVDASTPAMDQGVIDWDEIKNIQSENNATIYSLEPGEERTISITEEKKWHLIIFHNEAEDVDDVIPIRIINDYGNEEETMYKSLALSLPSLWMTGFVVYRVVRLKKANRSLIDSTPSHLWEEE
ncbi:MAG: phosphatase PAP2 family protein [Candidatus Poseidoniales archaeon]|nr:MAG: phosphatase PAP2 family protein [Candidatus Poseidoniales archaeon]